MYMATQANVISWLEGGWKESPYAVSYIQGLGIDTDHLYGFQCKDLANAFADWLGHPLTPGDAYTAWTEPQDSFWEKVPYISGSVPQVGDMPVWRPEAYNGLAGHIDIVYKVNGSSSFISLAQNWLNASLIYGSPPRFVTHAYNLPLYGYLRPKLMEENMQAGLDVVRILAFSILGYDGEGLKLDNTRRPNALTGEADAELQRFVGQNIHDLIIQFYNEPAADNYRNKEIPAIYALARQVGNDTTTNPKLQALADAAVAYVKG